MAYRYLLFYKPYNVLSQFTDAAANTSGSSDAQGAVSGLREKPNRATLKDYVSVPDVYAVGRLDRDSEGLILLTNDGPMQHRLSHPKFEHKRQYWVQVEGVPDQAALTILQKGVRLRDYQTRPAQVRAIAEPALPPRNPPIRYRRQIPTAWLELTLTEGKNRQVRRMTAAVGFPTLRLVRSALFLQGELALTLDALQPGEWRELTAKERRSLPSR